MGRQHVENWEGPVGFKDRPGESCPSCPAGQKCREREGDVESTGAPGLAEAVPPPSEPAVGLQGLTPAQTISLAILTGTGESELGDRGEAQLSCLVALVPKATLDLPTSASPHGRD